MSHSAARVLALVLVMSSPFALAGCGGPAKTTGGTDGSPLDAAPPEAAVVDASADVPGVPNTVPPGCPAALVSPSELATTPRADRELELLAIAKGPPSLVADQVIYDRLVRDVRLIKAERPSLANITFWPPHQDGKRLFVKFPLSVVDQIEKGEYHAWDCLNASYGLERIETFKAISREFVAITLKGLYNMDILASEYAKLPEVISVGTTTLGGDGPTICVSLGTDTWQYAFDEASGDCPLGCIDHHYWLFSTSAAGTAMFEGDWTPTMGEPPAAVAACVPR